MNNARLSLYLAYSTIVLYLLKRQEDLCIVNISSVTQWAANGILTNFIVFTSSEFNNEVLGSPVLHFNISPWFQSQGGSLAVTLHFLHEMDLRIYFCCDAFCALDGSNVTEPF